MKRIMIIGNCGAGKSTLARKLHAMLGLELIHLDQHYWKPNWTESAKDEWKKTVEKLASKEQWIIDGNYGGTFDIRLKRADTIIYLYYPTFLTLYRVLKRIYIHHGKVRPDMPDGCPERFNWNFIHYVLTYNLRKAKGTLQLLKEFDKEKKVVILRNDKEVHQFLKELNSLKSN